MSYVTQFDDCISRCHVVGKCCPFEGELCSQQLSAASLGFVHLKSPFLCVNTTPGRAEWRQAALGQSCTESENCCRAKNRARKFSSKSYRCSNHSVGSKQCPTKDYIDLFWIGRSISVAFAIPS